MTEAKIEELQKRIEELEAAPAEGGSGWVMLIYAALALFGVFLLIGIMSPQRTYREVAADEAKRCIASGDDGKWDPGMGSLKDYCALRGAVKASQEKALADGQAEAASSQSSGGK